MKGNMQLSLLKRPRVERVIGLLKWLNKYVHRHLFSICIFTVLGLTGTLASLVASLFSKDLVDIVTGHKVGELLTTFILMIITQLGASLIGQVSSYVSAKITQKVDNDIKADVYEKIMNTEWEELSKLHSGELIARWSSDTASVSSGILNLAPNAIIYVFRFLSALWMVVKYEPTFAVFALISIPISAFTSKKSVERMKKTNMGSLEVNAKLSGFTNETFTNIQIIKGFDMLKTCFRRLRNIQEEYVDVRLRYQRITIINSMILIVVSMLVTYATYGWGVYKVWSGVITYGTMTLFISLSSTLSGTVQSIINLFPSSISVLNAVKRLKWLEDLPKENYEDVEMVNRFRERYESTGITVRMKEVQFSYVPDVDVLCDVSFEAKPRELIAFVGPSGEGKTTLMRLILALLKPQEGNAIVCGGIDSVESFPLSASTRQLFAYVPQGNTMFSGTIADNMRNVKEDATDEEIVEALKIACAWDFVEKLPDGINTKINERGGGLSEGQAQRLSIARAIVRNAPILLLDEATSALDMATEKRVLRNIVNCTYPRTTIVSTHRPSVLSSCERVYTIENNGCRMLESDEIRQMLSQFAE